MLGRQVEGRRGREGGRGQGECLGGREGQREGRGVLCLSSLLPFFVYLFFYTKQVFILSVSIDHVHKPMTLCVPVTLTITHARYALSSSIGKSHPEVGTSCHL